MITDAQKLSEETNLPIIHFYDWVLSVLCISWFVGTLLVFDVFQRISLIFGSNFHQRVVILQNRMLCFSGTFVGMKIRIKRDSELEPDKPYIIISNHQSLADIPILSTIFHTHFPRFVSKQELARWIPGVSINLRRGGSAIIDRSNSEQAVTEIVELGKRMQAKRFAIIIFPEGTRAREGEMRKFRHQGTASLIEAAPDTAIIPVTIDGTWKLAAHGGYPVPSGVQLDVVVGQPLQLVDYNSPTELIDAAYTVVSETLSGLRATTGN